MEESHPGNEGVDVVGLEVLPEDEDPHEGVVEAAAHPSEDTTAGIHHEHDDGGAAEANGSDGAHHHHHHHHHHVMDPTQPPPPQAGAETQQTSLETQAHGLETQAHGLETQPQGLEGQGLETQPHGLETQTYETQAQQGLETQASIAAEPPAAPMDVMANTPLKIEDSSPTGQHHHHQEEMPAPPPQENAAVDIVAIAGEAAVAAVEAGEAEATTAAAAAANSGVEDKKPEAMVDTTKLAPETVAALAAVNNPTMKQPPEGGAPMDDAGVVVVPAPPGSPPAMPPLPPDGVVAGGGMVPMPQPQHGGMPPEGVVPGPPSVAAAAAAATVMPDAAAAAAAMAAAAAAVPTSAAVAPPTTSGTARSSSEAGLPDPPEKSVKRARRKAEPIKPFNDMLYELMAFRSREGHCRVPVDNKSALGRWVASLRSQYSSLQKGYPTADLTEERLMILRNIDFIWDLQQFDSDARWKRQFEDLVAYKRENGHCNAPQSTPLGKWVKMQRENYRETQLRAQGALPQNRTKPRPTLSEERIAQLQSIGFAWKVAPPAAGWEHRFEELVEYKRVHGDCNVPQAWPENRQLGRWVMKQRCQYTLRQKGERCQITDERIQRLNDLGFSWTAPSFRKNKKEGVAVGVPGVGVGGVGVGGVPGVGVPGPPHVNKDFDIRPKWL